MNIRCRGPAGQSTLTGLDPDVSVAALQGLLAERTGVPAAEQELLTGFPPAVLRLPADRGAAAAALPLASGDTLVVRRAAPSANPAQYPANEPSAPVAARHTAPGAGPASNPSRESNAPAAPATAPEAPSVAPALAAEPTAQATSASARANGGGAGQGWGPAGGAPEATGASSAERRRQEDEDEELARAIAASLGQELPSRGAAAASAVPAPPAPLAAGARDTPPNAAPDGAAQPQQKAAPSEVAVHDGSGAVLARRVIASDNSCLFNAVGYVMEGSRARAPELRRVIAAEVAGDPETYSEAFLGRPNADYCRWILGSDHWGGAIELSILSRHYGRELAAYDVQTRRCDVYGQDAGLSERGMLVYDGLHYDALALAAFPGAAEELDVTMFEPGPQLAAAERAAAELVAKAHEARQFTDVASFTLRCGVCQIGVRGEREAVEHAKATGHSNFSEYH